MAWPCLLNGAEASATSASATQPPTSPSASTTTPAVETGVREFTSAQGQKMRAEILGVSGDDISLRREDGRTFQTKISIFSAADQDYIRVWAAHPPRTLVPLPTASAKGVFAWSIAAEGAPGKQLSTPNKVAVVFVEPPRQALGKTFSAASAGWYRNLVLCSDDTLISWGSDNLGDAEPPPKEGTKAAPKAVVVNTAALRGKRIASVYVVSGASYALCADGTLYGWGRNSLPPPDKKSALRQLPEQIAQGALAGKKIVLFAPSGMHCLAVTADGALITWGANNCGQLGNGVFSTKPDMLSAPAQINLSGPLKGKTIVALAAGTNHSMALCDDGTLYQWGWLSNVRNGGEHSTDLSSSEPDPVRKPEGMDKLKVVAISDYNRCSAILYDDGSVGILGNPGSFANFPQAIAASRANIPEFRMAEPALIDQGILKGKRIVALAPGGIYPSFLCDDGTAVNLPRAKIYYTRQNLGVELAITDLGDTLKGKTIAVFANDLVLYNDDPKK